MRRFLRTLAIAASVFGLTTVAPPMAQAASGDVTSTTVTLPAAVQGLASAGFISARDGGMYSAYVSGNDYKIIKTKPDGSQDTSFGVGGIATIATGSSGSKRVSITPDVNGKWWATVILNNVDAMVFAGTATGAPATPWTITSATQVPYCAAAYPSISATTWGTVNHRVYTRRDGGVWLKIDCSPRDNTSTALVGENLGVLVAMTAAGVRDTTVALVPTHTNYSSTSRCYYTAILSDVTSVAPQPELYVIRTEHNVNAPGGSTCTANQGNLTAAGITGYSVVSVLANGSATSKSIASAGDATDGILAARLDPGTRIVTFNTNLADLSTMSVRRIKTDGTLDTTIGTNGVKTLSIGTAPAGQASVTASAVGIVTTPTKVYFSVLIADSTVATYGCQNSTPNIWGYRMAMVSPADGFASGFGTNGIGGRVTVTAAQSTICTSAVGGGMSVDTDGRPRMLRYSNSTTFLDVWEAPVGANGGGEGGTGSGGPTTDTGGAASKGDGLQVLNPVSAVDNTVYAKLPATIGLNSAIQVLTDRQAKKWALVTRTPGTCLTLTTSILATSTGTCTVRVVLKETGDLQKTLTTKVVQTPATAIGTGITASEPVQFAIVGWKLSATAKTQLAKIAETAKTSSRIVIVGHSALLRDTAAFNQQVSIRRAAAVKTYLQKLGVKTAVNVVGLGSRAPLTTKKTESAQAKNRRVVVYFYP